MSTGRTEVITLTQAKQHLRMPLDVTQDDDSLYVLLEIAHGLVFDKCKSLLLGRCRRRSRRSMPWSMRGPPTRRRRACAPPSSRRSPTSTGIAATPATGTARRGITRLSPRAEGFLALVRDPVLR